MSDRFVGVLVAVFFIVVAIPAMGGVVRVSGDTITFEAGSDEVNVVVVNPRGSAFDPGSGQFVTGATITDGGTHIPTAVAPCRVLAGTAICETGGINRAVVHAGNKNDVISLTFNIDSPPMQIIVDGGLGDDTITGGSTDDILDGGSGNDTINGDLGDDTINGGLGDDTINGGPGRDHLFGNAGKDEINGDANEDEIDGGIGDDTIDGGQGADVIRGDLGGDRITANDGFVDNINCGVGIDRVIRDANDVLKRCE
jgi:Ca2+-binding RTX toxin-like protein